MNIPYITIIVPTYNSANTVRKCIESLFGIDYPKYDILIVDDGSIDNTINILEEYKDRIACIKNAHVGPSKCRNIAAKQAKGEFLAFTDSDCIVDKNWLRELAKGFINDMIVSVGGSQLSPSDETYFGRRVQDFFELTGFLGGYIKNKSNKEVRQVAHNPSCNAMYRKAAFLDIGGFDETLWPSEDVDLDYRLKKRGSEFRYNPQAIVYHYRPQNLRNLLHMMFRYGIMQGRLTKRYGFFRKIQIVPIVLILLIILFIINPLWLLLLIIPYVFVLSKIGNILEGNFVSFLCISSVLYWIVGLIKGLITK